MFRRMRLNHLPSLTSSYWFHQQIYSPIHQRVWTYIDESRLQLGDYIEIVSPDRTRTDNRRWLESWRLSFHRNHHDATLPLSYGRHWNWSSAYHVDLREALGTSSIALRRRQRIDTQSIVVTRVVFGGLPRIPTSEPQRHYFTSSSQSPNKSGRPMPRVQCGSQLFANKPENRTMCEDSNFILNSPDGSICIPTFLGATQLDSWRLQAFNPRTVTSFDSTKSRRGNSNPWLSAWKAEVLPTELRLLFALSENCCPVVWPQGEPDIT